MSLKTVASLLTLITLLKIEKTIGSCSWTISDRTLDLSKLESSIIITTEDKWTYLYTPCSNGLMCQSNSGMIIQETSDTCVAYLAKFNSTIIPSYNSSNGNDIWTFNYNNGEKSGNCTQSRNMEIEFICNQNCNPYCSNITTTTSIGICSYKMNIPTIYACTITNTPTTYHPTTITPTTQYPTTSHPTTHHPTFGPTSYNSCIFETNDGYTINLSSLSGAWIEGNNDNYRYIYSPCMNFLQCYENSESGNGQVYQVMAEQLSKDNGYCISYIAQWDSTILPEYSINDKAFAFKYNNGQITDECYDGCEFIIEWICNNTINNGNFKVETAGEIDVCTYEMIIQSPLACTS